MENTKIIIQCTVSAEVSKVWEFWTKPQHIVNWNFASDDWHCPKATNDLKIGGKLCATMASKDGKASFDFEGTYDEIVPFQRIRYHLEDGRAVDVDFNSEGEFTKVIETFDPENENSRDMQQAGWQAILDNFKQYTEHRP